MEFKLLRNLDRYFIKENKIIYIILLLKGDVEKRLQRLKKTKAGIYEIISTNNLFK